jgi:hypothetical protein
MILKITGNSTHRIQIYLCMYVCMSVGRRLLTFRKNGSMGNKNETPLVYMINITCKVAGYVFDNQGSVPSMDWVFIHSFIEFSIQKTVSD